MNLPALPGRALNAAGIVLVLAALAWPAPAQTVAKSDEYLDFNPGRMVIGSDWTQVITIQAPPLRSEIRGDIPVQFTAPGMTQATALCWQQPTPDAPNPLGHDEKIADITLDANGKGSFVFPADKFPNGPVTVRILAENDTVRDERELQLYNQGGVVWNQGFPKTDPPAAAGMKLLFADDFDKPLSISHDGKGATYNSHKPGGGDFSGWPFSNYDGPLNPFSQVGTFLRIRASKVDGTRGSTGLISPVDSDFNGVYAKAPCYFECRFTGQSAPGTWPAFWLLTKPAPGRGTDELDIMEGYGGVGPGNPNHPGYSVTTHFWGQKAADGSALKAISKRVDMLGIGSKSYWSTTFHTYGVKITDTDTIYYLDNIEVLRHPTGELSKTQPLFFLINYAIGGISGWKIDLAREGDASDMYVDFVRVYQGG